MAITAVERSRMAGRILTAFVGAYAAAAGIVSLGARLAPIDPSEAVGWAMLLSFLVYAGLMLWAFHEQRLGRVAAAIWGLALLTIGSAWLLGPVA
jgi:hypothetical protein